MMIFSLAAFSQWGPGETASVLPLLAVTAMFVGHALGVVPVCQLLTAEVISLSASFSQLR
jgi:hypothetical protein